MTQLNVKDITPDDKQELDEALQREVCGANHGILFLLQTFRTFALFYLFIIIIVIVIVLYILLS